MKPERWNEVDEILQSVLERAPAQREAYLARVCAGDEELRREVLTLLAAHGRAGSFMAAPALGASGDAFEDGPKLKQGDLVGPYKITGPVGRGGMGEVYLALHATQNREVALKILPLHFLDDAQRVWRFRREARAVLALNHPNIVTVYDIGEDGGVHYISTEFVEGQTLRERMARERTTVTEAVDIALQVAGALAYAHEKGVVHRDVKPENVMLRPDGYVKVLDFGIAKLTERRAAGTTADDLGEAETRMQVETSPGMVMGTPHYMSPEQARGKQVDERADTWSLGVLLYEMLTGRQPFEGETASDIIAMILGRDPAPLSAVMTGAPAELERILSKALDKSKEERYQTAKDFHADLRRFRRRHEQESDQERSLPPGESAQYAAAGVSTGGGHAASTGAGGAATGAAPTGHTSSSAEYLVGELRGHRKGLLLGLAALVAVVGLASYGLWSRGRSGVNVGGDAPARAAKITPLPVNGVLADLSQGRAAISPDGKYVVYVLLTHDEQGEELQSLWEMYRPTGDVKQLLPPSKDHYGGLSFTQDGDYVYYFHASYERLVLSLYKMSVIGGAPKKLIDNIKRASFAPSPDGKRIAFTRQEGGGSISLVVTSEDGTGERLLTTRDLSKGWIDGLPAWSPDGKKIACFAGTFAGGGARTLLVVDAEDGTEKEIGAARWFSAWRAVWLPDGSGLLVDAGDKRTAPIQVWHVSYPDGAARKITNDLNDYELAGLTADSGTLLAAQQKRSADVWVAPAGGDPGQPPRQLTFTKGDGQRGVAWTPDGKIVFTSMAGGIRELWVMNADGGGRRQLTSVGGDKNSPAVSPDGRFVVFASGDYHLWRIDMDGSNLKQLTFSDNEEQDPLVTPDGKWVIFSTWSTGKLTPWKVPVDGGRPVQLSDMQLRCNGVSPDGKLIACADTFQEQGTWKFVLLPVEGGEPTKIIEPPIEFLPPLRWTADGRALTVHRFQGGTENIWKFPLDGGQPAPLTSFRDTSLPNIARYALSPDGKRFAVVRANTTSDLVLIGDFK